MVFFTEGMQSNSCYNIGTMTDKKKSQAGSFFWQIIFPAFIGLVFVLLAGGWIVLKTSTGNVSRYAEISTVLLLIPVFFNALLVMVILGASVYLILRIIHGLPSITERILAILEKIQQSVTVFSKNLTKIVIQPTAFLAGFRRAPSKENQEINLNE